MATIDHLTRTFVFLLAGTLPCVVPALAQAHADFDPTSPAQLFASTLSAASTPPATGGATLPDAPDAISPDIKASHQLPLPLRRVRQRDPSAMAGPYEKYILPGQVAPTLSNRDKVILGVRDAFSPFSFVAWVTSASYEHFIDGSPNYGRNGKAYSQRLGASAVRDVSAGLFSDSLLAPLLREDPRYYKFGSSHSIARRVFHAASHTVLTQRDDGRRTVNFANLGGKLGTSMLNNAYYPESNRGVTETAKGFGGSLEGSALSFILKEFLSDALEVVLSK